MTEDASKEKPTPSWLGPVAGALILVGGYVGYQEWKEREATTQICGRLKRSFQGNMDAMMGPAEAAIGEANKQGNQSPMGGLTGSVAANKLVMDQLNADCPGWTTTKYD